MFPCEMARYIAGFQPEARKYGRIFGLTAPRFRAAPARPGGSGPLTISIGRPADTPSPPLPPVALDAAGVAQPSAAAVAVAPPSGAVAVAEALPSGVVAEAMPYAEAAVAPPYAEAVAPPYAEAVAPPYAEAAAPPYVGVAAVVLPSLAEVMARPSSPVEAAQPFAAAEPTGRRELPAAVGALPHAPPTAAGLAAIPAAVEVSEQP
jgi:hypothetical protein